MGAGEPARAARIRQASDSLYTRRLWSKALSSRHLRSLSRAFPHADRAYCCGYECISDLLEEDPSRAERHTEARLHSGRCISPMWISRWMNKALGFSAERGVSTLACSAPNRGPLADLGCRELGLAPVAGVAGTAVDLVGALGGPGSAVGSSVVADGGPACED